MKIKVFNVPISMVYITTYGFPYAPFYAISARFFLFDSFLVWIFFSPIHSLGRLKQHFIPSSFFLVVYFHSCVHSPTHKWLYGAHLSAQRCNHYNFIVTQTCANV